MPDNTPTQQETTETSDYQTAADFIEDSDLMLSNAKANSAIMAQMTPAGYTVAVIDTQLSQLEELRILNEKQKAEYGQQYAATQAWKDAKDALHPTYMDHLDLARLAFKKDPAAQAGLALNEKRKVSQAGYIDQALIFYDNALDSVPFKTALAAKGVTTAMLTAGQTAIQELRTLRKAQQKETGEAQTATRDRDAIYDALHEWVDEFKATAKVVLRTSPELMEEMGIVQPS